MAKCKCGAEWKWNACSDTYVDEDGKDYKVTTLSNPEADTETEHAEVEVFQCTCGAINSVVLGGEYFFDCPEFHNETWGM